VGRFLVLLAAAAAVAAAVAALRRRRPSPAAHVGARPAPPPVRPLPEEPAGEAEAPTRFVEVAEAEEARRHAAAERLKAEIGGEG
jgi:hypothetical protein